MSPDRAGTVGYNAETFVMNSSVRVPGVSPARRSHHRLPVSGLLLLSVFGWTESRAAAQPSSPPLQPSAIAFRPFVQPAASASPAGQTPSSPPPSPAPQPAPAQPLTLPQPRLQLPQPPPPPPQVPAQPATRPGGSQADERPDATPEPPVDTAADRQAAARARGLVARGKYDEAMGVLREGSAAAPGGEASLEFGLLLRYLGRPSEAAAPLTLVVQQALLDDGSPQSLLRGARGARALGLFRRSNSLFQQAARLAPEDAAVQAGWGELFLEKYNTQDALEAFRAAIKLDPKSVSAQVGLARALLDENATAATAAARAALDVDDHAVGARLVLAEIALDERRLPEGRAEIEKALDSNPSSLEALALLAAVSHLQNRQADFDTAVTKALAINPTFGDVYRVPGAQVASHYRFDEAVGLTRKALEIQPESPRALADLGMHLLRTGDEPAAREALEKSFKLDAYDFVTYNLLGMLDKVDKFETITDGDIVLRLHPQDVGVMRGEMLALAKRSLAALSKQYGFTPKGPILIEAFPQHDDFAVRNLGLPGMAGALGACFGRVVTMDSPRARPPGSFNWSATLWHELAHVVTLQMSNQRVPRWLTEGISMFEERRASPGWGREFEFEFLNAYAKGQTIKLADLNSGFMTRDTIALAYHQSSLLVEHIVELYGDAGLQQMLRAYGEGQDTDEVVKQTLKVDLAALQVSYDQFLDKRFGKARLALLPVKAKPPAGEDLDPAAIRAFANEHPESYLVQAQAGQALMMRGDLEGARALLERAIAMVPQTMGDNSARAFLADVLQKQGDKPRAMQELETLLAESTTGLEAARSLATLAKAADDVARERAAVDRIVSLDPFDAAAHATLGRLALGQQDTAVALRELQTALTLGSSDQAAIHTDMAEVYLMKGDQARVREHAIAALEIAPRFERAQELLLKVVDAPRR